MPRPRWPRPSTSSRGAFAPAGQEHFYLETQAALAIPGRGRPDHHPLVHAEPQRDPEAWSSHCLGPAAAPGRLHRAAGWGARSAARSRRPPTPRSSRPSSRPGPAGRRGSSTRGAWTCGSPASGTRISSRYKVGFTPTGGSTALELELYSDGGCAADLSLAVMERSMLHAENAYFIPHFAIRGTVCRTNLPSNTAMRGFGGPQGIAAIENVIEEVAAHLGLDPLEVRRRNLYGGAGPRRHPLWPGRRATTPCPRSLDRLAESSDYRPPSQGGNPLQRGVADAPRGLALMPVKFGISFTRRTLNQGERPGQHLPRRHDPGLDRRDRDGPGSQHQDPPARRRRVRAADRVGPGDADLDREEQQHLADGRLGQHRPERRRPRSAPARHSRQRLAEVAAPPLCAAPGDGLAASPDAVAFDRRAVCSTFAARRPARLRANWCGSPTRSASTWAPRVLCHARRRLQSRDRPGQPFLYFTNGAAVSEVSIDRLTGE